MARLPTLVAILLLCAATAHADAVPPPPADCPDGSHGRTGHAGPWCNPTTCTTDADCREEGTSCREAALCVTTQEYRMGGWAGEQRSTREMAHGPCRDGQCAEGECRRAKYCMRGAGGTSQGGGSSAGPEGDRDRDEPEPEPEPGEPTPTAMDEADEPPAPEPRPEGDRAGGQPAAGQGEGAEAEEEDDGGCSVGGGGSPPAWALALLALIALRSARRAQPAARRPESARRTGS